MVKRDQFAVITKNAGNSMSKLPYNITLFDDGTEKYWWGLSLAGTTAELNSISVAGGMDQADTQEYSMSGFTSVDSNSFKCSTGNTNSTYNGIFGCFIDKNNHVIVYGKTFYGGAAWWTTSIVQADNCNTVDIWVSGHEIFVLVAHAHSHTVYKLTYDGTHNATYTIDVGSTTASNTFMGKLDTSTGVYKFAYANVIDRYYMTFDSSTHDFTKVQIVGTFRISAFSPYSQYYWFEDGIEYLMDPDLFCFKSDEDSLWHTYTATSSVECGITREFVADVVGSTPSMKANYLFWGTYVFEINKANKFLRIQNTATVYVNGWADFTMTTGGAIHQLQSVDYPDVSICKVNSTIYQGPILQLINLTEPFTNEFLHLRNDDDQLIWEGFVRTYEYDTESYKYECESGVSIDLNQKIDMTFKGKTAAEIIKEVIDEYCTYIKYSTHISATPTTTYDIVHNKTLADVLIWADNREGYLSSIRPNGEIYWDQYTASGIAILDTTNISNYPKIKKTATKYSRVIIYGGYVAGKQLVAVSFGEPNYGTFYDWFPEIRTQTELDAMLVQVINDRNIKLGKVQIECQDEGMLYYGTSSALTLAVYSIAAETWYHMGVTYDAIADTSLSLMFDAYYIPYKNITDKKPEQNEQNIAKIESNVNNPAGKGVDPSRVEVDSDDEYGKGIWPGIVDWVTTGEVIDNANWADRASVPPTSSNVGDHDGHTNIVNLVDAGAGAVIYSGITATSTIEVEFWAKASVRWLCSLVQLDDFETINAAGFAAGVDVDASQEIDYVSATDGSHVTTGVFCSTDWNHWRIEYKDNDYVRIFLNGFLIFSGAGLNIAGQITGIQFGVVSGTMYFDSIGVSVDGYKAWSNFGAGHLQAQSIAAASGMNGEIVPYMGSFHPITQTTNTHHVIITVATAGATINIGALNDIPEEAKYIFCKWVGFWNVDNVNNYIMLRTTLASEGFATRKEMYGQAAGRYLVTYPIIKLHTDQTIHYQFNNSGGGGSILFILDILGYWS